jgi:hypothetical protein
MSNGTSMQKDKDYAALKSRLSKLESGSKGAALMQYLIYPLILALIGVYFERQIIPKDILQKLRQIARGQTGTAANKTTANHCEVFMRESVILRLVRSGFRNGRLRTCSRLIGNQMKWKA